MRDSILNIIIVTICIIEIRQSKEKDLVRFFNIKQYYSQKMHTFFELLIMRTNIDMSSSKKTNNKKFTFERTSSE